MLAHPHANDEIALAFHRLSEQAMQHYVSCQQQFSQQIAAYSQWHIDDDSGSLQLSDECLTARSYSLTAIATYIPAVQDFAWAWANDAFAAPINEAASRLRELATHTQYQIFNTPSFVATPTELDTLCALALWHLQGAAVFKVKDAELWVCYVVH